MGDFIFSYYFLMVLVMASLFFGTMIWIIVDSQKKARNLQKGIDECNEFFARVMACFKHSGIEIEKTKVK